jgi:nitrite reductase/ring-hydroxylating ferredoxin subunit
MRKLLLLLTLTIFYSCEKNEVLDLLPNLSVNISIDRNLPQYINLQTPSGWAYTNGGLKGILVLNTGIGSPPFKAFDRACPNNDCNIPMEFDGSLKMKCECDASEYSIIDGSPQTSGHKQFAREYKVTVMSGSILNIRNF